MNLKKIMSITPLSIRDITRKLKFNNLNIVDIFLCSHIHIHLPSYFNIRVYSHISLLIIIYLSQQSVVMHSAGAGVYYRLLD